MDGHEKEVEPLDIEAIKKQTNQAENLGTVTIMGGN
jgi:hypothetical protein